MFFARVARFALQPLTVSTRKGLVIAVLLAAACTGWLKQSAAVVQNSSAVIVSAASNEPDALAPDALATAYGQNLATQTDIAATPQTPLAGTTVTVAGRLASLLFASPGQINFLIPADTPAGSATVVIRAADGTISTGTTNINAVAPSLFTAGGVASGFALRVKADGAQSYEPIAEFDAANSQFKPKAIDLNSAAGDQVFLVFFLSGLHKADPAQVRVILGGDEFAPVFAGAVPGAAGLDQINLLLPRELAGKGVLDLAVKAPNARPSNSAKIQIGGGASTLAVSKLSKQTVVAGETLEIEGVNMPTSNVEVLFEPNVGVAPETLTPTKMTLRVPYGVASGTVKISVNKQIAYVSPTPLNVVTSVSGFVEEFKDGKRVAVVGLPVVLSEPGGRSLETVTNSAGAFLIRDAAVSTRSNVQIKGLAANGLNYEASPFSLRVFGNRDNQASQEDTTPRVVELKPNGSVTTSFAAADTPLNERLQVATAGPNETAGVITAGQVTFDTGNSTITCLGGVSGCQLALNVFDPGRTPTNLPAGVFSSTIAQITPFGATLTPGGKLIFPNSDATPAGTPLRVYRYDQTPTSMTFGQFVDIGPGIISSDGQRLETEANAVTQASYYLISRQWRLMATIIGHVVEADGVRPVRRAVVSARGQSTFTDGNGGFVLRNIPVIKANDTVTLEVSFHRADGTVTRTERAGVAISTGAQIQLATDIPLPARNAVSGPTILAPETLSITEGETRDFNFLVTDLPTGVTPSLVNPPSFAALRSLGADAFALRLTPPTGSAGNYQITIAAGNARQTLTAVVIAASSSAPIARSQAVTTNEDSPVQITLVGTNTGSAPTYTITAQPLHGSLSGTPPNLTYTPATNYNGTDSFSFRVNGSNDPRSTAAVSIAVRPINDPPIITSTFGPQTVNAGQSIKLIIAATDADGDQLICTAPNAPAGVTILPIQNTTNAWHFEWQPTTAQEGPNAIDLLVTDGKSPVSKTLAIAVRAPWAKTSGPEGAGVEAIIARGNKIFAGTSGGVYISNDNGQTWTVVNTGLANINVFSLAVNGTKLLAGTDGGVYVTDNDGQLWTPAGLQGIGIDTLTVNGSRIFAGSFGNGVYVTDDEGRSWRQMNSGLAGTCDLPGNCALYVQSLASKGTKTFVATYGGGVFVTSNGGQLWTPVNIGLVDPNTGLPHLYIKKLLVSGTKIYLCTWGTGVYVTDNDGQSWTALSRNESGFTNPYTFAVAVSGTKIFAGTIFGGVYVTSNNGQNWAQVNTGLLSTDIRVLTLVGTKLFAGTYGDGLAATTNEGQSWTPVNTGLTSAILQSFAVKGTKVFAAAYGAGVYLTENDGRSWSLVNSGFITSETNNVLLALTTKGNKVFAGTYGGGIYVTNNDGQSWSKINQGLRQDTAVCATCIRSLTASETKVYAGTGAANNFADGGEVYVSSDDGQRWTNTGLATNTVRSLTLKGTKLFAGTEGSGVYIYDGQRWTQVNSGLDNHDVRALVVSGTKVFAGTFGGGIFVTEDDGQHWRAINNGLAGSYVNALTVSGTKIYAGLYGGAYVTTNDGQSWIRIGTDLTNDIVNTLAVNGSKLFAGTPDGVSLLTDASQSWSEINKGLVSKFTNTVAASGSNLFTGTLGNGIFRSVDQGASWIAASSGLPPSANVPTVVATGTNVFAGTLGQGVYRSSDNGNNWAELNNGLPTANVANPQQNPRNVNALRLNGATLLAATDGGIFRFSNPTGAGAWTTTNLTRSALSLLVNGAALYAGTFDDGVYRSTDGGVSWQSVGKQTLGNLTVSALGVSASGASIFAGTSAGIYRSDDQGQNWRAVNRDLPSNLVVTSFQTSGAKLYAGSVYGVFLSEDNGENWKQINAGLLDIYVTSFALDGDRLIAGTKVGGVFISQIPDQPACIGIAAQPVSKTISSGQSTTLTVTPSGNQPFQFQWYQGTSGDFSKPVAGATGNAFTTPPLTATTNYWVLVANNCGSVNSETAAVVLNATPQTDLAITQTISPAQPKPGDNLTFTFTLTNRGSEKALAVNLTNPLPVEVDFTNCSATGGGVCGGAANNRTVFFAEMAGNASATITLTAKVKADAGGKTLRNNAGVSAATNDANLSNNSDPKTVTVQQTSPVIAGLNPTMAIVGGAGFTLAVNGSNFAGGAKVRWNGSERVTSFVSAAQLTAQIPASDLAAVGTAAVTVANPDGQTSNSVAFTITAPQRLNSVLRVVASTGSVGSTVAVPIELVSQGDENALGFSLTFDPTVLSNPQAALGSDATGGALNQSGAQAALGRLGVVLALPTGQRFVAGLRQVAMVTFSIAAATSAVTANIGFGDQPVAREVSDVNGNVLPANYAGGAVTITRGFEADVAPRPNGNGILSVTDWVLVGRFASGDLAVDAGSEFQRTDCAPRSSFGNGAITVSDWVQAGRYAAGLDPLTPAAGPTAPAAFAATDLSALLKPAGWPRLLRVGSPTFGAGQSSAVNVELLARGEENAVSFSLQFDARQWRFVSAVLGEDARKAALSVNTKFAADGHVGFALALPPGQKFEAGMRSLLTVNLVAAENGGLDAPQFAFSDWPAARELADAKAEVLAADWMPGGLSLFKVSEDWAAGVVIRVGADGTQRFESVAVFDPAQNKFVAVPIEVAEENEQVFLALFGKGWQQGVAREAMEVMVDGVPVEVLYAGEQATGTAQLNLRLLPTLKGRGEVAVRVNYAGRVANPVKIFIK